LKPFSEGAVEIKSPKRQLGPIAAALEAFIQKQKADGSCYFNHTTSYNVLLMGQTGSGKTSVLNLFMNFNEVLKLGHEPSKIKRFHEVSLENTVGGDMASKTSGAKVYEATILDGFPIKIVDTPGFADTRGSKTDREHVEMIISTLTVLGYVNCVMIVINGRSPRLNADLRYALTEITAIMTKEILNHILVVFTNTDAPRKRIFKPVVLAEMLGVREIPASHMFDLENPIALLTNAKELKDAGEDEEKLNRELASEFSKTTPLLLPIYQMMVQLRPVPTHDFLKVRALREKIEQHLLSKGAVRDKITHLKRLHEDWIKKLEDCREKKTPMQDVPIIRQVESWELVPGQPYYSTLCFKSDCHSNCHVNCQLPLTMGREQPIFKDCMAMNNEVCTQCGHGWIDHYHMYSLWEKKTESKQGLSGDYQVKFDTASTTDEKINVLIKSLAHRQQLLDRQLKPTLEDMLVDIKEYERLGLPKSFSQVVSSQIRYTELLIENNKGDPAMVKELEQFVINLKTFLGQLGGS
jgi:GTP-binding protein EngB required for normal cell division